MSFVKTFAVLGSLASTFGCGKSTTLTALNSSQDANPRLPFEMISSNEKFDLTNFSTLYKSKMQGKKLNQFSFDLFRALKAAQIAKDQENYVYSGYSIRTAFAMIQPTLEANGELQKEFAEVFKFDVPENDLHLELKTQMVDIHNSLQPENKENNSQYKMTSLLFVDKNFNIQKPYLDLLKKNYNLGVGKLDFMSSDQNAEKSRQLINGFVSSNTKGLIKDLIPRGIVNNRTKAVMTNSIYMLADWASPFTAEGTFAEPFTVASGDSIQVPTMHQVNFYPYFSDATVEAASLKYASKGISMLLLVPKPNVNLSAVEDAMNSDRFEQILSGLKSTKLSVSLPKFQMGGVTHSFKSPLESLGLKESLKYVSKNNFPRMLSDKSGKPLAASEELFISEVFHQAKIKVDEKGTEAAAATAITMATGSSYKPEAPPIMFKVNKPSLFFIYDSKTGSILFMGRLARPGL